MPNPEKKLARLAGRTSREAWAELQRRKNEPRFDQILAHLESVDGTLHLSDVRHAVELAAGGSVQERDRFLERIASRYGPVVPALQEVLDAAISAQGADKGDLQLVDEDGALRILVQRGFARDFLEHFACVRPDGSSICARSFAAGSALVIRDVHEDPAFAPHLAIAKSAGFRAVQSIPLLSPSGAAIGMLSVHFRSPLPSSDWRMQSLQESAIRAAAVLSKAGGPRQ